MDLYAQKGSAIPQKLVLVTIELLILVLSAWILFGRGRIETANLFGWTLAPMIPARTYLTFASRL